MKGPAILVSCLFPGACASSGSILDWLSPFASADEAPFQLVISERHRQDFAVFARAPERSRFTDAAAIDRVFEELGSHSDAYCAALLSGRPFASADLELLHAGRRDEYVRNRGRDSLHSLRAGCRNFFEMNDLRPDRDFRLTRRLYAGARFDCYSVGLLQPYIMHNQLGCSRLTMIDINWRILHMHRELLRRTQAGAFAEAAKVDRDLQGIELKYLALHDRPLLARPAGLRHLCRPVQHAYCRGVLPGFRAALRINPRTPARLRLNLSTLHAGSYEPHGEPENAQNATIRVVYLSNAIEESYTSRAEFDRLLLNLHATAGRPDAGRASVDVLIHHVGGWKLFGLYEIRHGPAEQSQSDEYQFAPKPDVASLSIADRPAAQIRIRTICKDTYLSKSRSKDPSGTAVEYETHFERAQRAAMGVKEFARMRIPACAALYAETAATPD